MTLGIIVLGCEAGPRTSEHTALEVSDVRSVVCAGRDLGTIVQISVPAKTSPPRILPLGVRAEDLLRRLVGNRALGPLFPSRSGAPLSPSALRDRIGKAGMRVGVPLTPQRLRRSASSWQATYGASSGHLDSVFGWAHDPRDVKAGHYIIPTTTQLIYAHQASLSPLDRLEARLGFALL